MRKLIPTATILQSMTYSIPHCPRSHPIAGHTRNANPNAAPMSPIFFVRSLGADISEIYACTTPNPAPPSPQMIRETMKSKKRAEIHATENEVPIVSVRLQKRRINPRRFSPAV